MKKPQCRFCNETLSVTFANLGMSPLSNSYITPAQLQTMEPFYPLHAWVCSKCLLVQLQEFESPKEIFTDYAYFSSYSDSWLDHCSAYADQMVRTLELTPNARVVELASNDGYLLQYFKAKNIPVLGIEPAKNVARVAIDKGIPTEVLFFGTETAQDLKNRGHSADLLIGNNVLAHVPNLNGFVRGMKTLLKDTGVITMEFPHLLRLMEDNQFDTIYHEHFSYFSLTTVEKVFAHHGLTIFDVESLPTHGGSLRIYARHTENSARPITPRVKKLKDAEEHKGLLDIGTYQDFSNKVKATKRGLLEFLIQAKENGKSIVGYGAPAKGNTLLNYCGVGADFLDYTVDRNPHKQGHFLPGTHIPIEKPEKIATTRPDYLLILPWNLKTEISSQMSIIREWDGKFVVPIPKIEIF